MKLMINHQTHYQYSEAARNSIQYIKMIPQSGGHQRVHSWDLSIPGTYDTQRDAFNNLWVTSTQRYAYQQLTIMVQGIVEIDQKCETSMLNDVIHPSVFLQPTIMTECNREMSAFAHEYVQQKTRAELQALAAAILEYIPYCPQATEVHTPAAEVFKAHQSGGVCQDHSHIFIAMCRALGIPARYVSGYLYAPDMIHLASHAWAEAYIDQTWYCFDISNQIFTPRSHIYVAIGRDYYDVAPIRGVREHGGLETMHSIVQVLPC
ncbi:transglutaminase family protein [Acinetobacter sp. MB5]|uniref:transglutaminase family protein n=1 Tax=Acinetobacter sp. MB5 TaxID=2069438 RepID=UPI000DD0B5ED|nr:transglutaminase family protein [Acinetobacter sp. MB5]